MIKNAFYFILKAFLVLRIIKFSSFTFWSCRKNGLIGNLWCHNLVNKQLQYTYCPISQEVKATQALIRHLSMVSARKALFYFFKGMFTLQKLKFACCLGGGSSLNFPRFSKTCPTASMPCLSKICLQPNNVIWSGVFFFKNHAKNEAKRLVPDVSFF